MHPTTADLICLPGTKLACPKCRARIGTIVKALHQNWEFGLDAIRFEPGQTPDLRAPRAACRKCGADYSQTSVSLATGRRMWVHSEFGWLPPGEIPEDVPVLGEVHRIQ